MISEMVDTIKNVENIAEEKRKKSKIEAKDIIERANKEAEDIVALKVKEANAKAELRMNFAKSSAEENIKKNIKQCEIEVKKYKEVSLQQKEKIIKELIETIVS